jgi:hypothetical protein
MANDVTIALGVALLGVCLGIAVHLANIAGNVVAMRLAEAGSLLDLAIRLGVFAVLCIVFAKVVGVFFGALVRQHPLWFWPAFFAGLASIHVLVKHIDKR